MIKLRQITYACEDYDVDPSDYGYVSPPDILALVRDNPKELTTTNVVDFRSTDGKQFSIEQLRQLVAARGFLEVFCNWLEPSQVMDKDIRAATATIQHLLGTIWGKLDG